MAMYVDPCLFFRSGAERSGLFCAVSVMLQKMESEHEISVVNTVRQIKSRRQRALPNKVMHLYGGQYTLKMTQTTCPIKLQYKIHMSLIACERPGVRNTCIINACSLRMLTKRNKKHI